MNSADKVAADAAAWKDQKIEKTQMIVNVAEDEIGWPYAWGATGQKCTVANRKARMNSSKISMGDINLIRKHCQILSGIRDTCDGCIYYPGGERTNMYDCIGFVNQLLDWADVKHYGAGCTTMWNHEDNWAKKGPISEMPNQVCLVFRQNGNKMEHIGCHIGDGWVIHCSVEVKKQNNYKWTHYGIPKDLGGDVPVSHSTLKKGSTGPEVLELQNDLIQLKYDPGKADGIYGSKTAAAVSAFQKDHGLKQDGICGPKTWAAIDEALGPQPGPGTLYTVIIPHLTEEQAEELLKQYPDGEKRTEGSGS